MELLPLVKFLVWGHFIPWLFHGLRDVYPNLVACVDFLVLVPLRYRFVEFEAVRVWGEHVRVAYSVDHPGLVD